MRGVRRVALALLCASVASAALAITPEEFAAMDPEQALQVPADEAIGVFGWKRQEFLFVLENALIDLRYLYRAPTGKSSKELTAAVKAFQRDRGMQQSGRLSVAEFMDLVRRGNEFWQAPVFPGPLQVDATPERVSVQGSWQPETVPERDPVQASSVRCYRSAGMCSMVTAKLLMADEEGGMFHNSAADLDVHARDFKITQWTDAGVVAEESTMCVTYTLTIDAAAQAASLEGRRSGGEKCGAASAPPRRYRLIGGYESAAPYWAARQARLLQLRSQAFQQAIARIQQRKK